MRNGKESPGARDGRGDTGEGPPDSESAAASIKHYVTRRIDALNLVVGVVGIVLSLAGAWSTVFGGRYLNLSVPVWAKLLVVLVLILVFYAGLTPVAKFVSARARPPFPSGVEFPGVFSYTEHPSSEVAFDRSAEVEELSRLILKRLGEESVITVAGVSGVGKSILIKLLEQALRERMGDSDKLIIARFNDPEKANVQIVEDVISEVKNFFGAHYFDLTADEFAAHGGAKNENGHAVIILDQFETCLDYIVDHNSKEPLAQFLESARAYDDALINGMRTLLGNKLKNDRLTLAVVIRSDRYYDLRLLNRFGQRPYDAFEVHGLRKSRDTHPLAKKLRRIVVEGDVGAIIEDLQEQDGTILPVKAQIVGCMIEREAYYPEYGRTRRFFYGKEQPRAKPDKLTFARFKQAGGAAGLIEKYFRLVKESSPNPDITGELLYVLGIEDRVKTRYRAEDLVRITSRDRDDLHKCLDYLNDHGLLSRSSDGEYAFAHDFLAQQYNTLSGRLIVPVIRDNLAYSYATLKEGRGKKQQSPLEGISKAEKERVRLRLSLVKLLMLVFFGYRLLGFEQFVVTRFHAWLPSHFTPYMVNPEWSIDWHFLPIAVIQFCWGLYAIELINKIFVNIDHEWWMRLLSRFLVLMVVVGMIFTAYVPGTWMMWLGINGLIAGLKFYTMGKMLARYIGGTNDYKVIGVYTLYNSVVIGYIGAMIYPQISWDLTRFHGGEAARLVTSFLWLSPDSGFTTIFYAFSLLFVWFIYMYRTHVSKSAAVQFIGLYKRIEAVY